MCAYSKYRSVAFGKRRRKYNLILYKIKNIEFGPFSDSTNNGGHIGFWFLEPKILVLEENVSFQCLLEFNSLQDEKMNF